MIFWAFRSRRRIFRIVRVMRRGADTQGSPSFCSLPANRSCSLPHQSMLPVRGLPLRASAISSYFKSHSACVSETW